jgi:hypothetical protein
MMRGNLNTISMPSLVQAICLEEHKAALFLEHGEMEGVIYFDLGEIAHATLGSIVGDDAVIELVGWEEGSFHVSAYDLLPRRTITASWNYLLMEGMRRYDEKQAGEIPPVAGALALSPAENEQDTRLENELITMLSKLEHDRSKLNEKKNKGRVKPVTQILSGMVKTVNKYVKASPAPAVKVERRDGSEKEVTVNDFIFPSLQMNSKQSSEYLNRTNKHLASLFDPPSSYEDIAKEVVPVLEGYFLVISYRFNSPLVSDRWIEASSIFLIDLGKTLKGLQC